MDIDQLFLKFLTKTATKEDLSQLNFLLEKNPHHRDTLEKLEAYWQQQHLEIPPDEDKIWKQLQEKTQPQPGSIKSVHIPKILRYAAVISFLLIASFFAWDHLEDRVKEDPVKVVYITKQNPVRLKRSLLLPDGTKVHLNSESKITYPNTFSNERLIRLVGEAYFEVVPDKSKPFKVICHNTSTIVEGTSFNVRGYNDEDIVKVSLVEGKVSIDFDQDGHISSYALEPMQEATYSRTTGMVEVNLFVTDEVISWKNGTLYFQNASFKQVKEKIERWYGVKLTLSKGKEPAWNISGQFQNETLYNVMDIISHAENFTFKINESNVEIIL